MKKQFEKFTTNSVKILFIEELITISAKMSGKKTIRKLNNNFC